MADLRSELVNATVAPFPLVPSEDQSRIALSDARRLVVLAGPGTGKSSMGIMLRIKHLLDQHVPPEAIMLVSFTRTAAQDLREKLISLGVEKAERVKATTLHSLCLMLLRKNAVLASLHRRDRFLLKHEQRLMLYDLEGDFARITDREKLLIDFQSGWLKEPGSYTSTIPPANSLRFEDQVMKWLRLHRGMLIGEVVPLAFRHVNDNANVSFVSDLRHMIVDEYQDLNYLEQELVELARDEGTSIVIVGDDDQSIYSFKHAHPDGIVEQYRRNDAETVTLDICRRSPRNIVAIGNNLMRFDPDRQKEDLKCSSEEDGYVARIQWPTFEDEVEGIAGAVANDVLVKKYEPGGFLILVPNRRIGRKLTSKLQELGVDARGYFDQELFDDAPDAREAMAVLQLVADEHDPIAWRVILGKGHRTGRADRYALLRTDALARNQTPIEFLTRTPTGSPELRKYRHFSGVLGTIRGRLERIKVKELSDLVEDVFGADSPSVRELRGMALEIVDAGRATTPAELSDLLLGRVAFEDVPEEPSFVRVMTLHKSKGLTAQRVFLVSLVDGLIPNFTGIGSEVDRVNRLREARRLLYVGITRSAHELVLSSFQSVSVGLAMSFGLEVASPPSRQRLSTVSSSLMAELGPEVGRVAAGNTWLRQYVDRDTGAVNESERLAG